MLCILVADVAVAICSLMCITSQFFTILCMCVCVRVLFACGWLCEN